MTNPIKQDEASDAFENRPVLTGNDVNRLLNISSVTRWRLEKRGLLTPVPHLRRKLYAREEVLAFISGKTAGQSR